MKTLDVSLVPAILTIINRSGKSVEIPLYPDNGSLTLEVGKQIIYRVNESREYLFYYNVCKSLGLELEATLVKGSETGAGGGEGTQGATGKFSVLGIAGTGSIQEGDLVKGNIGGLSGFIPFEHKIEESRLYSQLRVTHESQGRLQIIHSNNQVTIYDTSEFPYKISYKFTLPATVSRSSFYSPDGNRFFLRTSSSRIGTLYDSSKYPYEKLKDFDEVVPSNFSFTCGEFSSKYSHLILSLLGAENKVSVYDTSTYNLISDFDTTSKVTKIKSYGINYSNLMLLYDSKVYSYYYNSTSFKYVISHIYSYPAAIDFTINEDGTKIAIFNYHTMIEYSTGGNWQLRSHDYSSTYPTLYIVLTGNLGSQWGGADHSFYRGSDIYRSGSFSASTPVAIRLSSSGSIDQIYANNQFVYEFGGNLIATAASSITNMPVWIPAENLVVFHKAISDDILDGNYSYYGYALEDLTKVGEVAILEKSLKAPGGAYVGIGSINSSQHKLEIQLAQVSGLDALEDSVVLARVNYISDPALGSSPIPEISISFRDGSKISRMVAYSGDQGEVMSGDFSRGDIIALQYISEDEVFIVTSQSGGDDLFSSSQLSWWEKEELVNNLSSIASFDRFFSLSSLVSTGAAQELADVSMWMGFYRLAELLNFAEQDFLWRLESMFNSGLFDRLEDMHDRGLLDKLVEKFDEGFFD